MYQKILMRKQCRGLLYSIKIQRIILWFLRHFRLQEEQNRSVEQFIEKVKEYSQLRQLTPYALHSLVKAIYVDEYPMEGRKHREKSVKIEYDIPREIDLDKLMKE